MGLKFRRQHPVGRFVVDFFCEELLVALEVDGGIHNNPEQRERDAERQSLLEERNIRFVRIPAQLVTAEASAELMRFLLDTFSTQRFTPLPTRERGRGEGKDLR